MTKASLISLRNLDLAWSRITAAKNLQHKRMFRHVYNSYEPGRRANLGLLHERLKGGWKPTSPIRLYMPKASGLLRPLTLLALDDQIVLQAVANQIAAQMACLPELVQRSRLSRLSGGAECAPPSRCRDTLQPNGRLKTFGLMLDENGAFARQFSSTAAALRLANERRNTIPDSHPFETKTGVKTKRLTVRERDTIRDALAVVYREMIAWMNTQRV